VSAIENMLSRLERVRRVGNGWMARCPAHEDRSPSLKLAVGEDGRVLVSCKVGCKTEDVLDSLGLAWRDLFDQSGSPPRQVPVANRTPRFSESRTPLTRESIEHEYDTGGITFSEYMELLARWSDPYSHTHVELDEAGEVTRYELR